MKKSTMMNWGDGYVPITGGMFSIEGGKGSRTPWRSSEERGGQGRAR